MSLRIFNLGSVAQDLWVIDLFLSNTHKNSTNIRLNSMDKFGGLFVHPIFTFIGYRQIWTKQIFFLRSDESVNCQIERLSLVVYRNLIIIRKNCYLAKTNYWTHQLPAADVSTFVCDCPFTLLLKDYLFEIPTVLFIVFRYYLTCYLAFYEQMST